jgi:hypothetical protein
MGRPASALTRMPPRLRTRATTARCARNVCTHLSDRGRTLAGMRSRSICHAVQGHLLRACLCLRQVRSDLDHRAYMPVAWRVDTYLDADEDDEMAAGDSLEALRTHRFEAAKDRKDTMTR